MALDFHETETLLPSEFLTDDFIMSENQKITRNCLRIPESVLNGFGSCGSSSSGFSTPAGSELGSTETESDEDYFVAELTRQMADYMLQEDDENTAPTCVSANSKWSDCNLGSKQRHDQRLISTPCKPSSVPAHAKDTDVGIML
ncbi:hypothetical protein F0562_001013 [Nyssa sinensis]|uniref:Uncharacterized protein n=1 Tax=Nyssa sinensis TaxID=561372 RepID=A0A5J5C2C4_9ASTE|nr:hypothetical protein F0562_001013 [Nyssa sinensis]